MTNHRYRRAVGLHYDGSGDQAPEISLKGDALDADEIVRLARRYGVPVVERSDLVGALDRLDQGETIPEKLYRAVALVLVQLERYWRR